MRRRLVFAFAVGVSIAGGFVACGIEEHGEAVDGGSTDATSNDSPITNDAPLDVPIDVPQACKTLDASACVDADIPDGWTYAAISAVETICPSTTDYVQSNFLTNLAPQGPCLCTCTASGTIDCSGTIEAGSQGGGCNGKWTVFDAGNDAACINTNWGDPHYEVPSPPTSTANAKCDASAPPPGWTATGEISCTPKCTADFCAVGSTYKRCIISNAGQLCPAPFTVAQPVFGIEAGVVTSCSGCACAVTGTCTATIQPFNSNSCDNPLADASPTSATCNNTNISGAGGQVNSFVYTPNVPAPGCSISSGGTASAQFASSVTVCCLP